MNLESPIFQKYISFLNKWEGGKSNDPNDTAASCAPWPGAVHTVKGITYCTYKQVAGGLGINTDYNSFLNLSNYDYSRIVYSIYLSVKGNYLPDNIAIAVTEAAWESGSYQALEDLQRSLNALGSSLVVDGIIGDKTIQAVRITNQDLLLKKYLDGRKKFLNNLSDKPRYSQYKKGWMDRINDFINRFSTNSLGIAIPVILILILLIHNSRNT